MNKKDFLFKKKLLGFIQFFRKFLKKYSKISIISNLENSYYFKNIYTKIKINLSIPTLKKKF